ARIWDSPPLMDVAAPRPDVGPALPRSADFDLVVIIDNILDGHDGIGALWDDPAGGDPHRRPATQWRCRRLSGSDARRDPKPPRRVGGPDGVAVHRGARERRQVE